MTHSDVQRVRSHLASLEAMLGRRFAANDEDALLEFRRECWAALLLVDDAECQEQIDLLVQYSKELFLGEAADGMKSKLQTTIAACQARLESVEGGYGKRWRDLRAA
jgi:hypothetical protein